MQPHAAGEAPAIRRHPADPAWVPDWAGAIWSTDDRDRVWETLWQPPQRTICLAVVRRHGPPRATTEDVEDMWADFSAGPLHMRVIPGYVPAPGHPPFWAGWVLLCLKRYCYDRGGGPTVEVPIEPDRDADSPGVVPVDEDPRGQPEAALVLREDELEDAASAFASWMLAVRQERRAQARRVLGECIMALRDTLREAAMRWYATASDSDWKKPTAKEIGQALHISENAVNLRLFQARFALASCLAEHGISFVEL